MTSLLKHSVAHTKYCRFLPIEKIQQIIFWFYFNDDLSKLGENHQNLIFKVNFLYQNQINHSEKSPLQQYLSSTNIYAKICILLVVSHSAPKVRSC